MSGFRSHDRRAAPPGQHEQRRWRDTVISPPAAKASEKVFSSWAARMIRAPRPGAVRSRFAGCVAQAEGEVITRVRLVDIVVGPSLPPSGAGEPVDRRAQRAVDTEFPKRPSSTSFPGVARVGRAAFLSVQEGCDSSAPSVWCYTRGAVFPPGGRHSGKTRLVASGRD